MVRSLDGGLFLRGSELIQGVLRVEAKVLFVEIEVILAILVLYNRRPGPGFKSKWWNFLLRVDDVFLSLRGAQWCSNVSIFRDSL